MLRDRGPAYGRAEALRRLSNNHRLEATRQATDFEGFAGNPVCLSLGIVVPGARDVPTQDRRSLTPAHERPMPAGELRRLDKLKHVLLNDDTAFV